MIDSTALTRTRPVPLFVCITLGVLILASWLWAPTRMFWDQLDTFWFYKANGSLNNDSEAWRIFWAITNHRVFDAIPGLSLIALFALCAFKEHRNALAQRVAIGLFMAIYCVVSIQIVRLCVLEGRLGPSMVLKPAYMLNDLVPWIRSKDSSTFSFPGDHATVMTLVSSFILYFCGKKYAIPAFIITILFSIPRTVGGAHWITDVLIGASFIPLVFCSFALFTPLGGWLIAHIERLITPYLKRFFPRFL